MRVASFSVGAIVLTIGCGIAVAAQQRDVPTAMPNATVAGTVVAGDTGLPIRAARVALTGERLPDPMVTVTDDQGTFVFAGLAAGSYYLWASKTGFVTASYGEKRAGTGRAGARLILTDRQRLDQLRFALPRAAVISGIVVDDFGEPAQGVGLQANRYVTVAGRRTLTSGPVAESDDRGMYRISSLPPGEYVVVASFRNSFSRMFQAGSAGRDSSNSPPAVLYQLRQDVRDSSGTSYVDTYYPGTPTISGATPLTLGAGDERSGVDIRMRRVVLSRVSGVVRDVDGTVALADVRLSSVASGLAGEFDDRVLRAAQVDAEGRFSFDVVPPGQYVLAARLRRRDDREPSAGRWAQQDINISGGNIDGVTLTLQHGMTLTGVVVSDAGGDSFTGGVWLTPAPDSRFLAEPVFLQAAIGEGGRFTMSNVVPGRFKLEFRSGAPEWRLASAMFGGRDMADFLLEVKPGDQLSGVLTVTKQSTELTGVVSSAASQPIRDLTVIVFSAEERFWLPDNRRNRAVATDADGRYSFANIPPGAYRLAAVDDYDEVAGIDANLLRTLLPASVAVTIGDGERKVQDLRVR